MIIKVKEMETKTTLSLMKSENRLCVSFRVEWVTILSFSGQPYWGALSIRILCCVYSTVNKGA